MLGPCAMVCFPGPMDLGCHTDCHNDFMFVKSIDKKKLSTCKYLFLEFCPIEHGRQSEGGGFSNGKVLSFLSGERLREPPMGSSWEGVSLEIVLLNFNLNLIF